MGRRARTCVQGQIPRTPGSTASSEMRVSAQSAPRQRCPVRHSGPVQPDPEDTLRPAGRCPKREVINQLEAGAGVPARLGLESKIGVHLDAGEWVTKGVASILQPHRTRETTLRDSLRREQTRLATDELKARGADCHSSAALPARRSSSSGPRYHRLAVPWQAASCADSDDQRISEPGRTGLLGPRLAPLSILTPGFLQTNVTHLPPVQ